MFLLFLVSLQLWCSHYDTVVAGVLSTADIPAVSGVSTIVGVRTVTLLLLVYFLQLTFLQLLESLLKLTYIKKFFISNRLG
jgi:hypothetical protein